MTIEKEKKRILSGREGLNAFFVRLGWRAGDPLRSVKDAQRRKGVVPLDWNW